MKKLKGFYNNNRVFVILMGIVIFCLAIIAVSFIYVIISQNNGDLYGNRLNGIETVKITDDRLSKLHESILKDKQVEKVSSRIKGRIIYINIYVKEGKVKDASKIAIDSLDFFTEDEKAFYDISYSLLKNDDKEDASFSVMGYKKSDSTIISWTNFSE
ncbi:MAG: hypothetical protein PHF21_03215 [Bacilli bacterium]|nr:hypothetical protein [Bacilli bacterium]